MALKLIEYENFHKVISVRCSLSSLKTFINFHLYGAVLPTVLRKLDSPGCALPVHPIMMEQIPSRYPVK